MQELGALFFLTAGATFLASVPPGLLNLNAAKTSVEKGKSNGIMFGVGVGIASMSQTYIAVRIAKYIVRHPEIVTVLLKVALVVFALCAIFFFLKGKKQRKKPLQIVESKKRGSFSKGFLLAWLNVLAIPFYSGLNTLFHANGLMSYGVIDELMYILAAGCGVFLAMYMYVIYFKKIERKTTIFSKNSNYILSVLMVLLLVITCFRLFY